MRIGEIAILGPHADEKKAFINSISKSTKNISENLTFGEVRINNQLVLHLYGISIENEETPLSWDLIAPKLLGYIAIFRWGDVQSFRRIQAILNQITSTYDPFIVVVGHYEKKAPVLPDSLQFGIQVDKKDVLTFCNVNDENSVRKVLLTLVEKIIKQAN
ncbi:hypothetical protein KC734_21750 [candidate division KSB1 bacterium]|nr:hypothetical protein [candidate division KSB1 bacterium]